MNSLNAFVKELDLNIRANHPITMIYTDDPFESIELVKDAIPTIRPATDKVFYWSTSSSWIDISERDKDLSSLLAYPNEVKLTPEVKKAPLRAIFQPPEALNAKKPIFIISLLSTAFKKDKVEVMQELRDFDYLCRNGINETYRVIVVANKSFELSSDYENLFGIINHRNPSKEEIAETYEQWFIQQYVSVPIKGLLKNPSDIESICNDFRALSDYVEKTLVGLTNRQVKLTLSKAIIDSLIKEDRKILSVNMENFKSFLYKKKYEEIASTGILSLLPPKSMDDIGGLDNLKEWLKERAFACTPAARAKGVKKPKGVLLVGIPGTAKSMMAQAMGGLLDRPTILFDVGAVFGELVGKSERQMRETLALIEQLDSCVLNIEEIDKIFGDGTLDGGTTTRVLGSLLTWLQETKANVFVVMTANRIENIPPELLRKGRLDELFYVSLPNKDERKAILDIHLKATGNKIDASSALEDCNEFSGSELEYVVSESVLKAAYKDEKLSAKHLKAEMQKIRPMAIAFKASMDRMKEWAAVNALPASKPEKAPPAAKSKSKFAEKFDLEI